MQGQHSSWFRPAALFTVALCLEWPTVKLSTHLWNEFLSQSSKSWCKMNPVGIIVLHKLLCCRWRHSSHSSLLPCVAMFVLLRNCFYYMVMSCLCEASCMLAVNLCLMCTIRAIFNEEKVGSRRELLTTTITSVRVTVYFVKISCWYLI